MNTWLNTLPLELGCQDDFMEPSLELLEGEEIIATITEGQKRLFSLWRSYSKSKETLMLEMRYRAVGQDDTSKVNSMTYKEKALENLFWISVRDEFQLWNEKWLGIRVNWLLVRTKPPAQEPPDFFGLLFGRGE